MSPLNPEGNKQYGRDFLLQLRYHPLSLCKPTNLPNLDVIKDKASIQKLPEMNRSAQPPSFEAIPVPVINTSLTADARGLPQRLAAIRLKMNTLKMDLDPSMHRSSETDGEEKLSPPPDHGLHKSEIPWIPPHRIKNLKVNPDDFPDRPMHRSFQTDRENTRHLHQSDKYHESRNARKPKHGVENTEVNPDDCIPDESTGDFLAEAYPVVILRSFLKELAVDPELFEEKIHPLTKTLNVMADDDETMRAVVNIIFDESVRLPNLRYSGARLCKALCNNLYVSPDRLHFRSLLLSRCDQEFKRRETLALAKDGGKYLRHFVLFMAELFSQLEFHEQKIIALGKSLQDLIKTILRYESLDNFECADKVLKLVLADLNVQCLKGYERNSDVNNETTPDVNFMKLNDKVKEAKKQLKERQQ